jgi:hypothetical protein
MVGVDGYLAHGVDGEPMVGGVRGRRGDACGDVDGGSEAVGVALDRRSVMQTDADSRRAAAGQDIAGDPQAET